MKKACNRANFHGKHLLIFHIFLLMIVSTITAFEISAEDSDKYHAPRTEIYYNKKYNFSISLPADWEIKKNIREGKVLVTFVALSPLEGEDDVYHDLVMVAVPKRKIKFSGRRNFEELPEAERKSHLDDYSRGFLQGLSTDGDDFKIEDQGFDEIDKRMARWIIASGRLAELDITTLTYLFSIEKRAYTISCMAQSKDFERYKKIFEETAKSFRFGDAETGRK